MIVALVGLCTLRFSDFYKLISNNFALLPALASDAYYTRKFSSTLITSLVTGTPVVVDDQFMEVCWVLC